MNNLYQERDAIAQGNHYMKHVMAMTVENLRSKSAIAAELAHRDIVIDSLQAELAARKVDAEQGAASLVKQFRQRCSDMNAYWRASDDHGVMLRNEQATELLRDLLDIQVEILPSDMPTDMILHCPRCHTQHIDETELHTEYVEGIAVAQMCGWDNPPHRSHLCHSCGLIWRPADVPTNGVATIKTKGKADNYLPGQI